MRNYLGRELLNKRTHVRIVAHFRQQPAAILDDSRKSEVPPRLKTYTCA
jgi:hypothetical protein